MKNQKSIILILICILSVFTQAVAEEVQIDTLLISQLEGIEGREVRVSKVYIPANTSLPRHWHPGEEFAYILEGSITLWQKGKDNQIVNSGEVVRVPLEQIHTGITGEEGVSLIVFRVHEQGKPDRVLVE